MASDPKTHLEWGLRVAAAKGITGSARVVLWVMAHHAGEDGMVWCSKATVAAESGLGTTAVKSAWKSMEDAGWIERDTRAGDSDLFLLVPDAWPTVRPKRKAQGGRRTPGGGSPDDRVARRPGRETTGSPDDRGWVARRPGVGRQTTGGGSPDDPEPTMNQPLNQPWNTHSHGGAPDLRPTTGPRAVCVPPTGLSDEQLHRLVDGCLRAVEGERPATRRAHAVDVVRALWADRGPDELDAFLEDVDLVARACRECPDRTFARLVRGEGWAEKANNSRRLSTVLDPRAWGARLLVAREWSPAAEAAPDPGDHVAAELARMQARGVAVRPLGGVSGPMLDDDPVVHERLLFRATFAGGGDWSAWARRVASGQVGPSLPTLPAEDPVEFALAERWIEAPSRVLEAEARALLGRLSPGGVPYAPGAPWDGDGVALHDEQAEHDRRWLVVQVIGGADEVRRRWRPHAHELLAVTIRHAHEHLAELGDRHGVDWRADPAGLAACEGWTPEPQLKVVSG